MGKQFLDMWPIYVHISNLMKICLDCRENSRNSKKEKRKLFGLGGPQKFNINL